MLAKLPPLGWNSWNTFGEKISDALIREMADIMVDKGYLAAGYEYLVIDDCWSLRDRACIPARAFSPVPAIHPAMTTNISTRRLLPPGAWTS